VRFKNREDAMSNRTVLLVALAVVVLAAPATAEVYTISLNNGTEFQSRHRPEEASFDSNIVLVLTDVGNRIALSKADIKAVEAHTERDGFGKRIDTHTVSLGWAPNDAPQVDPEAAMDPMTRLLGFLEAERANQPNYSVQQFVEPGMVGGPSQGGLPVSGLVGGPGGVNNIYGGGATSFPVGSSSGSGEPSVIDN
jgi:hypothetical protein